MRPTTHMSRRAFLFANARNMLLHPLWIVFLYSILTADWFLFFLRTRRPLFLARAGVRFCFTAVYLFIYVYNPPAEEVRSAVRWLIFMLGFDLLLDFLFVRLMESLASITRGLRGWKRA